MVEYRRMSGVKLCWVCEILLFIVFIVENKIFMMLMFWKNKENLIFVGIVKKK